MGILVCFKSGGKYHPSSCHINGKHQKGRIYSAFPAFVHFDVGVGGLKSEGETQQEGPPLASRFREWGAMKEYWGHSKRLLFDWVISSQIWKAWWDIFKDYLWRRGVTSSPFLHMAVTFLPWLWHSLAIPKSDLPLSPPFEGCCCCC